MLCESAEKSYLWVFFCILHHLTPDTFHSLVPLGFHRQLPVDVLRAEDGLQIQPGSLAIQPLIQHILHMAIFLQYSSLLVNYCGQISLLKKETGRILNVSFTVDLVSFLHKMAAAMLLDCYASKVSFLYQLVLHLKMWQQPLETETVIGCKNGCDEINKYLW